MITLTPLSTNIYKVAIDALDEQQTKKLITTRDYFPNEWVRIIMNNIPDGKSFVMYDHYSMTLTVKPNE